MTEEQIINVCQKYDNILISKGIDECIRENNDSKSLRHIRWMLQQIPIFIENGKLEKANRWLGFIQGVFWVREISNIEELKDDNR